ncbi:hypothetical protein MXB_1474 [Myxobolus squamalis]|nr:hypothetical protein MXB_1474 [Myxobolus squamalis]
MAFPLLKSGGQISVDRRFILEMVDYIDDWVPLFVDEFKKQNELDQEKCTKLCTNFSQMIKTRLNCYRSSCSLKILNYLNDIFYIQDRFIKEFLVLDPFLKFKHNHNLEAINKFQSFIDGVNTKYDTFERHSVIFNHLFAGNLIDFSSVDVLKHNISQLSHQDCLKKVENCFCFNL